MDDVQIRLSHSEAEAVLRAIDLVRTQHLHRNRHQERPMDLLHEEAAERKLNAALRRRW